LRTKRERKDRDQVERDTQMKQQIIVSGVGGQGIIFITHVLAEAAIRRGLPVYTSENHGMAQRGGTVLSHVKVGAFFSPLIIPSRADGIMIFREENLEQHGFYLSPGGWAVINAKARPEFRGQGDLHWIDADRLAGQIGNPQSVNLIVLGYALARVPHGAGKDRGFFCSGQDIIDVLKTKLAKRGEFLKASLEAFELGASHAGK
jgi:indolepyruvate ferredoxin oxidoreductase beta subunit